MHKPGDDQGLAQLGDHVVEGRLGLGPVPRLAELAVEGVVGVVAVRGIPNDDQGLDQHPERDRALDGVLDPVAGLPDTHLLLADGVGRLDRPAHRVSLDDLRRRGGLVEAEQRQVVGLGRIRFADEHAPPEGVAETAVPDARHLGHAYGPVDRRASLSQIEQEVSQTALGKLKFSELPPTLAVATLGARSADHRGALAIAVMPVTVTAES